MLGYNISDFDEENINVQEVVRLIDKHKSLAPVFDKLEQYYSGKHAIANRQRDPKAPNNKITVNFAKYITDISTGYFMSNPITYTSTVLNQTDEDREDLDNLLVAFDKAKVDDTDADNAFFASMTGVAYEYVYVAEDAVDISTKSLNPRNTFMLYDMSIEERELAAIYYTIIKDASNDGELYGATILTKHYIYTLVIRNSSKKPDVQKLERKEHYFGEVPVIAYKNNHCDIGDYEQVIPLIDAYNVTMSDRVNDVSEFCDAILVIYGTILADGENSAQAKKALMDEKLLELSDKQTMGAEWLTRQLDEQGVEVLQNSISRDILRMAYVPDFSDENFASNASGVAIAFKCLLLEWLTKTKERYYRTGLSKRIRLFCTFLGLKQILIDADSIIPKFSRALPTNRLEEAQVAQMLDGVVSRETILQNLSFVEDPLSEIEKVKAETEEATKRTQSLFQMRQNTPPEYSPFPSMTEE